MAKVKILYTPEGGSKREWLIDLDQPAWDLRHNTEEATDWPWNEFVDRLTKGSAKALDALIWTLRKRDEPRLDSSSVKVELSEFDIEEIAEPKKKVKDEAEEGKDL